MPQLLHPSFLRLGRRTGAFIVLVLAALGLLVTGLARPAEASDPYVAGSDATRVVRLTPALAGPVTDRAIRHEKILGVPATRRTIERVVDRRGHRTYDEVTDLDARGRPVAVLRYATDGRIVAATRLGWQPGNGRALAGGPDAIRAADRLARSLGVVPAGQGTAERRGANGWFVRWSRVVGGIPVPGDGLRVLLWSDGTFHGLTASEHPLAVRPTTTIPASTAEATVTTLLDRWIPASSRQNARIVGSALAWIAPNDTFEPARPDAPAEVRRLAWVVSVRMTGPLAGSLRALEVSIDAGDGTLLGGDVLR